MTCHRIVRFGGRGWLVAIAHFALLGALALGTSGCDDDGGKPVERSDTGVELECETRAECDDGNPCTEDRCGEDGECEHDDVDRRTPCADDDRCDGDEFCDGNGECVPGDPVTCDDSNTCTDDVCIPDTGECQFNDNGSCCEEDVDCDDDDVCTADQCAADQTCTNDPIDGCCKTEDDCGPGQACDTDRNECRSTVAAGEIVITELMFNPAAATDSDGEWIEIHNTTDHDIQLDGWTLAGGEGETHVIESAEGESLIVPGDAWVILGRSADMEKNGGVEVAYVYEGLDLVNAGDRIALLDGLDNLIDEVVYGDGWPLDAGAALSLSPDAIDAVENDDASAWCPAPETWRDGGDRGSPGAPNPACAVIDIDVDRCRLHSPAELTVLSGEMVDAVGRVREAGVTDISSGVDADARLIGQAGVGPDGSRPDENPAWTWTVATGDEAWDDADESGVDQYHAAFPAPAAGEWDLAYRFSVDGGTTWLYCDLDAGDGSDGSEDGYAAENAGRLVSEAGPCDELVCDAPPPASCANDGVTLMTPAAEGRCVLTEGEPRCEYPEESTDCSATGDLCVAGACGGGAPTPDAMGQLVFTEIMYDTQGALSESDAEWFELYNPTDGAFDLDGCRLEDSANELALGRIIIGPGAYALFARSDDPAENGGLEPNAQFDFGLNNGGDTLVLRCNGLIIDGVSYDDGQTFPRESARALSLHAGTLTAAENDFGANWCLAQEIYFVDPQTPGSSHYGTPGAPNPDCPQPDVTVDACVLESPIETEAPSGTPLTIFGRVFEAGITDRSDAVDADPSLIAQAGFGPDGSDPTDPGEEVDWTWIDAAGNPTWDAAEAADADRDEYMATLTVPLPGAHDLAYRFSRDGGETWLYCDRAPGSEDGYQTAEAGALTSVPSPCQPNPCDAPPGPTCGPDGITRFVPADEGVCDLADDMPICAYPPVAEDCGAQGLLCMAGECAGEAEGPSQAGDLIFTEVLYDPQPPLQEGTAEWIELHNPTARPLNLDSCEIGDGSGAVLRVGVLVVAAGGYALFARNADPGLNGGLEPDGIFEFALNNGGDVLTVQCGDVVIDTFEYDDGGAAGFPDARASSIMLDPEFIDAAANDDGASWCQPPADAVYFRGEGEDESDHLGTPGAPNPPCPPPELFIDLCRLQTPVDVERLAGTELVGTLRLFEAGVTDQTAGIDEIPNLRTQLGAGPDGSDPASLDADWIWIDATADETWDADAAGEPGFDQYRGLLPVPPPGEHDVAFRVSIDMGRTWTLCDLDAGDGSDGSEDGYQPANAGRLVSLPSPCEPNPCIEPPGSECRDADIRVDYAALGICAVDDGEAACEYSELAFDCGRLGATCDAGTCVGGAVPPDAPGQVIFSEIMYDPNFDLGDNSAEWFEIHNPSPSALFLHECSVTDNSGVGNTLVIVDLLLEPGGFAVFANSDNADINGGIDPHQVFLFSLTNRGDELTLACGDLVLDTVVYDDSAELGFPPAVGRSLSLDPTALDAADNDTGASWCAATEPYYVDDANPARNNFGTPGAPNPPCPEVDTGADLCRLQFPDEAVEFAGTRIDVGGIVVEAGVTDRTPGFDRSAQIIGQVGYGPDQSHPDGDRNWNWFPAFGDPGWDGEAESEPDADQYVGSLLVPSEGDYALAVRFSTDGGRAWTYCDLFAGDGSNGSEDGYQPDNAGHLIAVDSPCDPNPCERPAPACDADGVTRIEYLGSGVCDVEALEAVCTFDERPEDCSDAGATCLDGECVGGAATPTLPGQIIFTEVMFRPSGELWDDDAEWVELYNNFDTPLNLAGCDFRDDDDSVPAILPNITLRPGEYALLGRSTDPTENGGLVVDATFNFNLGNTGEQLFFNCDGVQIDTVRYDAGIEFPWVSGYTIALRPEAHDATSNDSGENWCLGRFAYYEGDRQLDTNYGSPGTANPECLPGTPVVDFCRLQRPEIFQIGADVEIVVYGRIFQRNFTNDTQFTDVFPLIQGQAGWGPDGSDPVDNDDWAWFDATANLEWDSSGTDEPVNDEYMATVVTPPDLGEYDLAYRFTADGGLHWTLCDRDAGAFADGSLDDYQPENAGRMFVVDNVCDPNPCDDPPADRCEDNNQTAVAHLATGICTIEDFQPVCDYQPETTDCSIDGSTCVAGVCVNPAARPSAPGDLVLTEILYNPEAPLFDFTAEWMEIHNPGDAALNLFECEMSSELFSAPFEHLVVPAGGYIVIGSSDQLNGGIEFDGLKPILLSDLGDDLGLSCDGVVIDRVAFDAGNGDLGFPDAVARSINLDPRFTDHAANDAGAAWCLAADEDRYFDGPPGDAGDHFGTPGQPNPRCPAPDFACPDNDPLEPNNGPDVTATGDGEVLAGVVCDGDVDVFEIELDRGCALDVTLAFAHGDGDLALEFTDSDGQVLATADSDDDDEMLRIVAPAAGTYQVRVSSPAGGQAAYRIGTLITCPEGLACPLDDALEPNQLPDDATPLVVDAPVEAIICGEDTDLFRVEVPSGCRLAVDLAFDPAGGALDLVLLDDGFGIIDEAVGDAGAAQVVGMAGDDDAVFYALVDPQGEAETIYALTAAVECAPPPPSCPDDDAFEPNQDAASATPLVPGAEPVAALICGANVDFWGFHADTGCTIDLETVFSAADGDLDLALFGPDDGLRDTSLGVEGTEHITYVADMPGTYVAQVFSVDEPESPYTIEVDLTCPPPGARLIINEVDSEQPGADAREFIEIFNAGDAVADLTDVAILFADGALGEIYGGADLVEGADTLPPGGYLVIGSAAVTDALLGSGVPTITLADGVLRDEPGDGIVLVGAGDPLVIFDELSFGAASPNVVEGDFGTPLDSDAVAQVALARCRNGVDRNDNAVDFALTLPTPGADNACVRQAFLCPPDDGIQPDLDQGFATLLPPEPFVLELSACSGADDFFAIETVRAGCSLDVAVLHTALFGPLGLQLIDANLTPLAIAPGGGDVLHARYEADVDRPVFIFIDARDDASNTYQLRTEVMCPVVPEVDACRLMAPLAEVADEGDAVDIIGRYAASGLTDQSPVVDAYDDLRVQGGFGPDGSDPDGGAQWMWADADPTDGWNGDDAGDPHRDEYRVAVAAPMSGRYDVALRVSLDAGATWTYCDSDGIDDGYDSNAAGDLVTVPPGGFGCALDDPLEPDDDADNGTLLVSGEGTAGVLCSPDEDWFVYDATEGCTLAIALEFAHADADLGLYLHAPDGGEVAVSETGDDDEAIEYEVTSTGRWAVRVAAPAAQANYGLRLDETCPPPLPALRINEFDYDQPDSDTAEFIEIINAGDAAIQLADFRLELFDSNADPGAIYASIDLGDAAAQLGAGEYLVIGNPGVIAGLDVPTIELADSSLQNGPFDGMRLVWQTIDGPIVVDSLSYEGGIAGLVEGLLGTPIDFGNAIDMSIGRCPDGFDADENVLDFIQAWPTPGADNDCARTQLTCAADDQYEDNDTPLTAQFIDANSVIDAIACSGDNDYYGIQVPGGCTLRLELLFTHALSNLDMGLGNVLGEELGAGITTDDAEFITYQVPAGPDAVLGILIGAADFVGTHYQLRARVECPPEPDPVDYCRLQHISDVASEAGEPVTVYGRVYEEGLTDRTQLNDPDDAIMGQVGYGPDASDPADNVEWIWLDAAPNPAWNDQDGGEPNNDEYMATFDAPAPGAYDVAYRFTVDGGMTWTLCDENGSDDGYQIDNAGALDPVEPPPPSAVDARGQVIFTEIVYDPHFDLGDDNAEWIEIHNPTAEHRDLAGCTLADASGQDPVALDGIVIPSGDYAVFARGDDPALNGGLEPLAVFDFPLSNGGDAVTLDCGGTVIDEVTWDGGDVFPDVPAYAISLDPDAYDADANDDGANWCLAADPWYLDADGQFGHNYGTPGAANPQCPEGVVPVDLCRTGQPTTIDLIEGTEVDVYGRVYHAGITDQSPGVDEFRILRMDFGFGPDGSDPNDNDDWVWLRSDPSPGWNAIAAEAGDEDEWTTRLTVPGPGAWDYAWRVSIDGLRTWTYCDADDEGSTDGYTPAEAGQMQSGDSACLPNPCDAPPAATCDGDEIIFQIAPGTCELVEDNAQCTYGEDRFDCAALGGRCEAGDCVDIAPAPEAAGDVLITEIMYDTQAPLDEGAAEWFELYNATDRVLNFEDCTVADNGANATLIGTLLVDPGAYVLFVRDGDPALNGGLEPDALFDFALNNGGDGITLTCDGVIIDTVTFDDGGDFVDAQATSLNLDPGAFDSEDNDAGGNWCLAAAADRYFVGDGITETDHYGTPGDPNPACPVPPLGCIDDDAFEPNDEPLTATPLIAGEPAHAILCGASVDMFALEADAGCTVELTATFAHADGDLALQVVGPTATSVAGADTQDDDETVEFVASVTGPYFIELSNADAPVETVYDLTAIVTCPEPRGRLVVNEVDYEQAGDDDAEFIELLNAGDAAIDLADEQLVFIDGALGFPYGDPIPLGPVGTLEPGEMLVIGDAAIIDPLAAAGVATLPLAVDIQEGAPDAVGIAVQTSPITFEIIDAISYEGVSPLATEGIIGAPADPGDGASIGRCGAGRDTDDNAADIAVQPPTPGAANDCTAVAPLTCPLDDGFEPNDGPAQTTLIADEAIEAIYCGNVDVYRITVPPACELDAVLDYDPADADLALVLSTPDLVPITRADGPDSEILEAGVLEAGDYLLIVDGPADGAAAYALLGVFSCL